MPSGRRPRHEVAVAAIARASGLTAAAVRRAVRLVLAGERAGRAAMTVTFLTGQQMRALNRRSLGRDRATDVIAFAMGHDGMVVGDVYVCPATGARAAARLGIPRREELLRLVVHGTLHALGYEHPTGAGRAASAMWRTQERYLRRLARGAG
jgi:probable rRNA maturation factor